MPEIAQTVVLSFPREVVWRELHDFAMVARSMPGVSLEPASPGDHLRGILALKLGPIAANFAGEAEVSMEDSIHTGIVRGQALDRKSSSRARSEVRFSLAGEGQATRLDIKVDFALSGPLAQFSRGSIVQEIAQRLTRDFARNLEAAIAERLTASTMADAALPEVPVAGKSLAHTFESSSAPIGLVGLLWSAFVAWLRRRFGGRISNNDRDV